MSVGTPPAKSDVSSDPQPSPVRRLFIRTGRLLRRPEIVIGLILLLLLGVLIVAPIVSLIQTTFQVQLMDVFRMPGAELGDFTLHHWQRVLSNSQLFTSPLINTLIVGVGTAVVALVLGTGFAWLVTRTDMPWRATVSALLMIPYVLPSWALTLPWLEFFRNRGVNMPRGLLEYWTGIQAPEWLVFGPVPIIIVMGLHYYPFVFTLASSALSTLDSQLEEASELLGASRFRIMRTVTLPIVAPAVLAALVLAFSRTVGTFGTPALLGTPVNFTVLPVQIRSFITMNQGPQAYILALMLIAMSVILLYVNERFLGQRRSFATIGGKGVKQRLVPLGKYKGVVVGGVIAFAIVCIVVPLLLLAWSSFMYRPGDYSLANFTWHYWFGEASPNIAQGEPGIFRSAQMWSSTANSLKIAVAGGLISAFLGTLVGYVVVRLRGTRFANFVERVSFLPMLVPSIAFGAIYLSLFSVQRGPLPALYGTFTLLILLVVGKQLPFTTRTGISSMHQVASELEEAAEIVGSSWTRRFFNIIWPLTRSGFIAGFLIVFVTTMRELSLFILVMSPRTQVLSTLTFQYADIGSTQLSNALMTFLVLVIFAMVGIVNLYERWSARRSKGLPDGA